MMTFADKTKNAETASMKSNWGKPARIQENLPHQSAPTNFLIQRKAGGCACGGGCPGCQSTGSNLAVSHPDDAAEIEADRVADKVMRMPLDEIPPTSSQTAKIHRKCDGCEDEEKIQRKESSAANVSNNSAPSTIVNGVLSSSGQPLDTGTKSFFEPRFGHDFSNVRVHTGSDAAVSARAINAKAYTFGKDIVFGHGQFSPNSEGGSKLLAHELAHVVQQSGAAAPRIVHRQEDETMEGTNAESSPDNLSGEEPSEAFGEDEAEEMKGGCAGERSKSYYPKNSVMHDFTIPKGCKATVTFTAKWASDSADCCTGASTYNVFKIVDGKEEKPPKTMPVAPNICGDESEKKPPSGTITVGGGYHKFNIKVDRKECQGIFMILNINVKISK